MTKRNEEVDNSHIGSSSQIGPGASCHTPKVDSGAVTNDNIDELNRNDIIEAESWDSVVAQDETLKVESIGADSTKQEHGCCSPVN